jgi:hypothetical protein
LTIIDQAVFPCRTGALSRAAKPFASKVLLPATRHPAPRRWLPLSCPMHQCEVMHGPMASGVAAEALSLSLEAAPYLRQGCSAYSAIFQAIAFRP